MRYNDSMNTITTNTAPNLVKPKSYNDILWEDAQKQDGIRRKGFLNKLFTPSISKVKNHIESLSKQSQLNLSQTELNHLLNATAYADKSFQNLLLTGLKNPTLQAIQQLQRIVDETWSKSQVSKYNPGQVKDTLVKLL